MKTFSARLGPRSKPLSRSEAWTCALINQLAFPGLGTILATRRWSGYAQSVIMVVGFFLTMGFMACYFASLIGFMMRSNGGEIRFKELCRPYAWAGVSGLGLCLVAWCWALMSSIAFVRSVPEPMAQS